MRLACDKADLVSFLHDFARNIKKYRPAESLRRTVPPSNFMNLFYLYAVIILFT